MEKQKDYHSQKNWQASADRREFTDLNYKGSERRSGLDRRSVTDRRIGANVLTQ